MLKLMNEPSAAAYVFGASILKAAPYARHMLVGTVQHPASCSCAMEDI